MTFPRDTRVVSASRHLGDLLSAYADRSLPAQVLHACDVHLVSCAVCRAAADAERRLLCALRAGAPAGAPGRLEAALLGLAAASPPAAMPTPPPSSAPAAGPARTPLAVLSSTAPPWHRSPVRAAVLAGLAAGACAAAAWTVAVAGGPTSVPAGPGAAAPDAAASPAAASSPQPTTPVAGPLAVAAVAAQLPSVRAAVQSRVTGWAQSSHE